MTAFFLAFLLARVTAQDFKAYQNYDFVPGDKILFEDDFRSDQDGEFPAHWKLEKGQGVVNKVQGEPALLLTDGNYAVVAPRIKVSGGTSYLGDTFTIEFDMYPKAGGFERVICFVRGKDGDDDKEANLEVGHDTGFSGLDNDLSSEYKGSSSEDFNNKWHHAAIAWKNGQVKIYIYQYRVLVVPDTGKFKPASVAFGGIGDADNPIVFKNVRVASGGGMNLIDKLTKDGRIIERGILFDVNKATLKPPRRCAERDRQADEGQRVAEARDRRTHGQQRGRGSQHDALASPRRRREEGARRSGRGCVASDDEGLRGDQARRFERHARRQGEQPARGVHKSGVASSVRS
jgi:hypothetical protein